MDHMCRLQKQLWKIHSANDPTFLAKPVMAVCNVSCIHMKCLAKSLTDLPKNLNDVGCNGD